ncbi:MAG TPA: hypothetical protein VKE22_18705 [Haliangiales bacterium]|nr:hypothetical protein [Haliangiales bacterium]
MNEQLWIAILAPILVAAIVLAVVGVRRRAAAARRVESGRPHAALPAPGRRTSLPALHIPRRLPVVLVHGLLGFDALRVPGAQIDYFRGVPDRLRELGVDVRVARVPPARGVAARARALAAQLDVAGQVVIAHSMGGLDARHAIARLGVASRVAALVTVTTPHLGTPIAELGSAIVGGSRGVLERLGIERAAFRDLTPARMREFNATVRDAPRVRYVSIVARVPLAGAPAMHPLLLPTYAYLRGASGDNDGVVPTDSQRWGEVIAEVEADHWAVIGWSGRFDAAGLYVDALRQLGYRLERPAPTSRSSTARS